MSAMASQITSLTIVYTTIYSRRISKKTSKLRVTVCGELTGEFLAQMASNAEMFPFDDVIMSANEVTLKGMAKPVEA